MKIDTTLNPRWFLLRTMPGCFPVLTDASCEVFGNSDLRCAIEDYMNDDDDGTVYTLVDVTQGRVVETYVVESVKKVVRK